MKTVFGERKRRDYDKAIHIQVKALTLLLTTYTRYVTLDQI